MNSCSEAAEDLLALQACYPEAGALVLTPAEEQALVLQSKTGLAGELGATLHIPDVLASGEPISLNISLPIAYPREKPSLTVHSAAPRLKMRGGHARLHVIHSACLRHAPRTACIHLHNPST